MNAIPRLPRALLVAAAAFAGLTASAQTIQFFSILKSQNFAQTDAATVTAMPLNPGVDLYPWRLETDINGTALGPSNPTPPNIVTPPSGSGTTSYNLTAPNGIHGWQYRPGFGSQAAMDTALNNGTYSVSLGGAASAFTLNLAGDLYPNSPLASLTGGTWNAATHCYEVNPADLWTLSTGLFNTNFLPAYARIEIDISGGGVDFTRNAGAASTHPFGVSDTGATQFLDSTELPTFIAGNTYVVDIRFDRVIDFQDISAQLGMTLDPTAQGRGVTMYESMLSFSIQAVPEPATYAAWAGVVALGLAAWRRRFRTV